jgi:hypothetical protein
MWCVVGGVFVGWGLGVRVRVFLSSFFKIWVQKFISKNKKWSKMITKNKKSSKSDHEK